ncbi:ABC-2 type transport system ATP-binding protein [Natranaerovirga pectinivora]|uniref:ABC-2 type transport system ATP-binding protein n=1 Tax=Natranaerovirga pectinivora TaxID=682400 RepID=A0A4R3MPD3_9FIRM|nr:ABC transporter ATP-binding protein [Natranaerovirga pectinivora]TCT14694.1 ABC-2 type transport system ATP-binding protein [Natranaerovirga pectinivora]
MLKTENLTKGFLNKKALKNVSIEIPQGVICGILGPNGSGKTTLMKIAAGLVNPTSGSIFFKNINIGSKTKSRIAYMPTEQFLYGFMTIKTVGQYFNDFYDDFNMEKYKRLIEFMKLEMTTKVSSLSTGMGAKLKIAATLSRNADLFMLDEPLNGIDLVTREKIIQTIVETANENNTILISSHLVDEMEKILSSVLYLRDGEIIIQGDANVIRSEHGKSIVDLYKEVFA